jgi:hypothetical protein
MKRLATMVPGLLGALLILAWLRFPGYADNSTAASIDESCASILRKGRNEEARGWLGASRRPDDRTIGELSGARTADVVEELYTRGATTITVADITSDPAYGETSDVLVVALPSAGEGRKSLLSYGRWHAWKAGFDAERDVGQACMFLWWD